MIPPSTITSRPTYQSLQPVPGPGRHWLVLQAGNVSDTLRVEMAQAFAPVHERLRTLWVGAGDTAALATALPDMAALQQALAQQPVQVSDRLYVLGTEPFLWSVAAVASQAGWTAGQWQLCHAGSLQRRVWCTHCHGFTEGVTTSIVACAGCGRSLLVRDHFSKRHGAFMGVMVDAEVPGAVPQAEEVFP